MSRLRQIVRDLERLVLRPSQPDLTLEAGYREVAPVSSAEALRDLREFVSAQSLRIRVLERQLVAEGLEPATTPDRAEIRAAVDVLEGLSRGQGPRLNTLELACLAESLRGLATWGLDD